MSALFAVISVSASFAGQTARKLKSLGGNVAVPDNAPLSKDAAGIVLHNPVAPLDGGTDRPPYKIRVAPPTKSGTPKIPKAATSAGSTDPDQSPGKCLAILKNIAVAEAVNDPDSDDIQCKVPEPVVLMSTKGKNPIRFTRGLVLDCRFAVVLAEFTQQVVQPLALFHMKKRLNAVQSGQGFVCRRRNGAKSGKLSEHAFGNAIDWTGFDFEGGPGLGISSEEQPGSPQGDFLKALRTSSCGYFTTVLGPGSNSAHATHFHFDLGRAGAGKMNPYRICE